MRVIRIGVGVRVREYGIFGEIGVRVRDVVDCCCEWEDVKDGLSWFLVVIVVILGLILLCHIFIMFILFFIIVS